MRDVWLEVFRVREYPGYDGTELRVHCPQTATYLPNALMRYDPTRNQVMTLSGGHTMAQRYAKDWIRLLGMHNCGRKVKVLGLQWERGHENPPIPFKVKVLGLQWERGH